MDLRDLIYKAQNRRAFTNRNAPPIAVRLRPESVGGATNQTFATNTVSPKEAQMREMMETPPKPLTGASQVLTPDTFDGTPSPDVSGTSETPTAQPDDGDTSAAPTTSTAPTLTPTEARIRDLFNQRNALTDNKVEDDDSKLGNFLHGAQFGAMQQQRTGNSQADLGATLGGAIGGGLRGLFKNKEDDERMRDQKVSKIDKELDRTTKIKEQEMKDRIASADYGTKVIKGKTDALEYIRKIDEPFYKSILADDRVTPEEAADAKKRGFGDVQPYDNRKIETEVRNGETFERRTGETAWAKSSLDPEKTKTPIKSTLDDGTEVYTTGDKLLDNQIAEKYKQAQLNSESDKYNTTQLNDYHDNLTKWRDTVTANGGNVSKIDNELAGLIARRADPNLGGGNDNFDPTAIDAQIQTKKGELKAAKDIYDNSMKNPPKSPAKLSTQNVRTGAYQGKTFPSPAAMKDAFPGKTEAEIKKYVEDRGGVFQ